MGVFWSYCASAFNPDKLELSLQPEVVHESKSAELGPAFKLSHFEVPPQCRAVVTAVHMGSLFHHIGLSHCRLQSVHAMHDRMVCHSADRSQ